MPVAGRLVVNDHHLLLFLCKSHTCFMLEVASASHATTAAAGGAGAADVPGQTTVELTPVLQAACLALPLGRLGVL